MIMTKSFLVLVLSTFLLLTKCGVLVVAFVAPSQFSHLHKYHQRQQHLHPINVNTNDHDASQGKNHHDNPKKKIEAPNELKSRRKFFGSMVSTTALAVSTSWFKSKTNVNNMAYAAEGGGAAIVIPPPKSPGYKFVGTYSDPINHPGGTRTIRLLEDDDSKIGDYQLAEVSGGGGIGEPKNYILPAVVIGDRAIVIDFSPKGGPKDFTGVLDKDGTSIKFLRDGNVWPRLKAKETKSP